MKTYRRSYSIVGLVVALALLASLVPVGMPATQAATIKDTATNVTVGSGQIAIGESVTTNITVNGYSGTKGMGAYDVRISFDRTKVNVVSVAGGDSVFSGGPISNGTGANSNGTLTAVSFGTGARPGPTGPTIKLFSVTWAGMAGGTSDLTLSITTLSDSDGDNLTPTPAAVNGSITVWQVPVASFTKSYSPANGAAPNTVAFTDTSTGPPQTWSWNFGDGTGSSSQNPSKLYGNAGNFTVTLTVANPAGSNSTSQTVSIYTTPAAGFSKVLNPTTGAVPNTVTFTDSSTGNITGWSWNFGDGTGSSSHNTSKVYNTPGNYTVTLTASNPVGSNSTSQTVNAYGTPAASFTKTVSPSTGVAPVAVNLTDTSTGNIVSWSWNFGDGTSSSVQAASKTYNTGGNYTITLTATNPLGSNTSAGQTVTVYSTPTANFSATPVSTNPGANISFTDSSTGNIVSWSWNFGDGTSSTLQNPTKSYAADGTYNVSLTATNPAGTHTVTKSGYITIISYQAELDVISNNLDTSGYAYLGASIKRFFNPVTQETVTLDGIGAYDAYMSYTTDVSMKNKWGNSTFPAITANYNIEGGTKTSVNALQTGSTPQPPIELFRLYPQLTGSRTVPVTVTLHFNTITRTGGGEIPQAGDKTKTLLRGDANSNGSVNITDALFIAQYLAGLRGLGETTTTVNPVNSATPRNDSATLGSSLTIQDALFIAQMLASLRNDSYVML